MKRARLSLDVSSALKEEMMEFCEVEDISITEAIRRGFRAMKYLRDAEKCGASIHIKRPNGTVELVRFL